MTVRFCLLPILEVLRDAEQYKAMGTGSRGVTVQQAVAGDKAAPPGFPLSPEGS